MSAALKLRLLTGGDLQVEDETDLAALRPRALLILLALKAGTVVSRDRLCDYLWPYTDQSTARKRLRMALLNMKKGLSENLSRRLITNTESIGLDIDPDEVDALRFMGLAVIGKPAAQSEAVELYQGDLLDQILPVSDEFDRMLDGLREEYRNTYLSILHDMMRSQFEMGDRRNFDRTLRRALLVNGANDDTAMLAMTAAAADRQAHRVQAIYDAYADQFRDSIGEEPPAAMQEARDANLAIANRRAVATDGADESSKFASGLAELRAKPRIAYRLSGARYLLIGLAAGVLAVLLFFAGGYFWSLTRETDTDFSEVFFLRPVTPTIGDCTSGDAKDLFEQSLLDALQSFEGSSTIIGSNRRLQLAAGTKAYSVDLVVTCLGDGATAMITVRNSETEGVVWIGRYVADQSSRQDLSESVFFELSSVLRH